MAKGMADYLCEQSRLVEREIARDLRRKEQEELRKFIEESRREIERTNRWLQSQEEAERIEPSAMFRLLKGCGSPDNLGKFEFVGNSTKSPLQWGFRPLRRRRIFSLGDYGADVPRVWASRIWPVMRIPETTYLRGRAVWPN